MTLQWDGVRSTCIADGEPRSPTNMITWCPPSATPTCKGNAGGKVQGGPAAPARSRDLSHGLAVRKPELIATVTATAAANGRQRRPATALHTRRIGANSEFVRPENGRSASNPAVVDTGKMKPREWRERRFVEGSAALRRYLAAIGRPDALPPAGEYYVCPCCLRVHGREALSDGAPMARAHLQAVQQHRRYPAG